MIAHDVGAEGDLQRQLGHSLRALRTASGLSQEAFADQLGIHRTYVGGLERGERNVTLQTVERIAELLGVPALSLLDGSVAAAGGPPPVPDQPARRPTTAPRRPPAAKQTRRPATRTRR